MAPPERSPTGTGRCPGEAWVRRNHAYGHNKEGLTYFDTVEGDFDEVTGYSSPVRRALGHVPREYPTAPG